jgi:hypothetical protein
MPETVGTLSRISQLGALPINQDDEDVGFCIAVPPVRKDSSIRMPIKKMAVELGAILVDRR